MQMHIVLKRVIASLSDDPTTGAKRTLVASRNLGAIAWAPERETIYTCVVSPVVLPRPLFFSDNDKLIYRNTIEALQMGGNGIASVGWGGPPLVGTVDASGNFIAGSPARAPLLPPSSAF